MESITANRELSVPPSPTAARASTAQPTRCLVRAAAVSSVGDGMFYVTSAVALTVLTGLSAGAAGVLLSLVWALAWAVTPVMGRLGDRLGLGRVLLAAAASVGLALLLLAASHSLALAAVALSVYAVGQATFGALRQAVVATSVAPAERTATRAKLQVLTNAGIAVGAGLGGLALAAGSPSALRWVLVFDALAFGVSLWLLAPLRRLDAAHDGIAGAVESGPLRRPGPRFYLAVALATAITLYMPLLSVGLPLALAASDLPTWTIAAVFVTNTIGVVALQRRAANAVTDLGTVARSLHRSAVAMLAGCVAFGLAVSGRGPDALIVLAVAVAGQVIGEVLAAAALWELGFQLADPRAQGRWQALWSTNVPAARAIGPALVTWLVVAHGFLGWTLFGVILGAAAIALARIATTSETS